MNINIIQSKRVPAYRQIADQLKKYVIDNSLEYGADMPTVSEVARMANVCVRTADIGINELVKEGICFRLPKKGTFVSDFRLKKKEEDRKACGIFISKSIKNIFEDNVITSSLYHGMLDESTNHGMDLFILKGDVESSIDFYHGSNRQIDFKGVVITSDDIPGVNEAAMKFPDLPFIYLNYLTDDFAISTDNVHGIFNDDFGGAYQLMNYMLGKGCQKILILSIRQKNRNYANRLNGIRQALLNSGFDTVDYLEEHVDREDIIVSQADFAREITRKYLSEGKNIDTIMCMNDILAEGAASLLKEIGRNDIRVCGHDYILKERSRAYKFATMAIDFEEMGRQGIKILAASSDKYPKQVKIMPRLIDFP